jgi:hypothetical protein
MPPGVEDAYREEQISRNKESVQIVPGLHEEPRQRQPDTDHQAGTQPPQSYCPLALHRAEQQRQSCRYCPQEPRTVDNRAGVAVWTQQQP